jgi:hypothetical protein
MVLQVPRVGRTSEERPDRWNASPKGCALAMASAAKPMKRAKAEEQLSLFLNRVADLNDSRKAAWWVRQVALLGSMLTDVPEVNDVDVMIELAFRRGRGFSLQEPARLLASLRKGTRVSTLEWNPHWLVTVPHTFLRTRCSSVPDLMS